MIRLLSRPPKGKNPEVIACLAPESFYRKGWHEKVVKLGAWKLLRKSIEDSKISGEGRVFQTFTGEETPARLIAAILPERQSRWNTPTRRELIFRYTESLASVADALVVLGLDDADHYAAAVMALARQVRLYNRKSSNGTRGKIQVVAYDKSGALIAPTDLAEATAQTLPWVCELVDMPSAELDPDMFAGLLKKRFAGTKTIKFSQIVGDTLLREKLGGLHAVGRAATSAPRMVILDYSPAKARSTVVLAGKGVTFDTGGLSLKISGAMVSMKCDMGGAAAVAGAVEILAATGYRGRVIGVLGLAENAIGPHAFKLDDVVTMHSGKTVEINNTDAEGRLVLADCLSYACRKYKPSYALDAATLTGAQRVATGNLHAAIMTESEELEDLMVKVGKRTGDLVVPLPIGSELYGFEFESQVADMRNSVANRNNAQSSCAAQFIAAHIDDTRVPWAHIDIAGPAFPKNRATGFGALLMAETVRCLPL